MPKTQLVFLGPPASGKGTQGRRLAEERSLTYLSTGALLRDALRDQTELGRQASPYLEKGVFIPDEIMIPMVLEWTTAQESGWVLDGFPRTVAQAQALDEATDFRSHALVLHVPDEELRRRVTSRLECDKCHRVAREGETVDCPRCDGKLLPRADDVADNFENRLREYRRLVIPAISYFSEKGRVRIVNGMGSPDEVYRRLQD